MKELIEKEVFGLQKMASGRVCLNLNSKLDWEGFPSYADKLLEYVNGTVIKKTDSFDTRVWLVNVDSKELRLVFDDFPVMVSLESLSESGDKVVLGLKELLEN